MNRRRKARREQIRRQEDLERGVPPSPGANSQPQFVVRAQGTVFQGPLPHPEILAGYDDVLPGAADRIITMAEKNQAHRQALEAKVIPAGIVSERLGQILAFILYLATLVTGAYLVVNGKEPYGVTEMLASTAAFAALYFKGQREKKRELRGKRPE